MIRRSSCKKPPGVVEVRGLILGDQVSRLRAPVADAGAGMASSGHRREFAIS